MSDAITISGYFFGKRTPIPHTSPKFSGGEIQVRLTDMTIPYDRIEKFHIVAKLHTSDAFFELLFVTDAIRRICSGAAISVTLPYLPAARQDRVCYPGEAFSLSAVANLLNAQSYECVYAFDAHSDKACDLIQRCVNIQPHFLMPRNIVADAVLVAPDTGAVERVRACGDYYKRPVVLCDKVRDPNDGKITSYNVKTFIPQDAKRLLIVDDICDGGRTFVMCAKALKADVGRDIPVDLWVTNLIASQGFGVFDGLIDNIYTANSFVPQDQLPANVHMVIT